MGLIKLHLWPAAPTTWLVDTGLPVWLVSPALRSRVEVTLPLACGAVRPNVTHQVSVCPSLACSCLETAWAFYQACLSPVGYGDIPVPWGIGPLSVQPVFRMAWPALAPFLTGFSLASSGVKKPGVLKFQIGKFYLYFSLWFVFYVSWGRSCFEH